MYVCMAFIRKIICSNTAFVALRNGINLQFVSAIFITSYSLRDMGTALFLWRLEGSKIAPRGAWTFLTSHSLGNNDRQTDQPTNGHQGSWESLTSNDSLGNFNCQSVRIL